MEDMIAFGEVAIIAPVKILQANHTLLNLKYLAIKEYLFQLKIEQRRVVLLENL